MAAPEALPGGHNAYPRNPRGPPKVCVDAVFPPSLAPRLGGTSWTSRVIFEGPLEIETTAKAMSRDFGHGVGGPGLGLQAGQHFMDILPLLSQVVRSFVPGAPQRQKVAFAMEKGAVLDLPMGMGEITVGLGWDVDEGECDLDVSAILLDAEGLDLEAVFFGRLESEQHGIEHTGDNLTGEGEGDDEQINVRLDKIGPNVEQVVFVVNIYTQNKTFQQVAEPFCRVVDAADGSELCRYALRDAGRENGLIIAKIAREAGGRWGFHALGLPCRGRTYKDRLTAQDPADVPPEDLVLDAARDRHGDLGHVLGPAPARPPWRRRGQGGDQGAGPLGPGVGRPEMLLRAVSAAAKHVPHHFVFLHRRRRSLKARGDRTDDG
ncbi:unnamed protein product [Prorocentrum cordatum]|uniref:TerD domain-containing protein n=1 Tax=Prorocentrum cordatum TaxID=2364126 RepID=A0ABN9SXQ5_9DINO|nr:unnamed protein product [Polarella glacialis]